MICFTSLSPNPDLADLQRSVISGWQGAGLEPIVLQHESECEIVKNIWPNVEAVTSCNICGGKKLIQITKVLERAQKEAGAVAIMNADCEANIDKEKLLYCGARAERGGMVLLVKNNYSLPHWADASEEYWGIDGFIFRADSDFVGKFYGSALSIGAPFWDYALPFVWMEMKRLLINGPKCALYHRAHDPSWDWEDWHFCAEEIKRLGVDMGNTKEDHFAKAATLRHQIRKRAVVVM
jgi:hypothetical protein